MKFEVYCDETLPDLFTSAQPDARFLMLDYLISETQAARIIHHRGAAAGARAAVGARHLCTQRCVVEARWVFAVSASCWVA